MDAPSHYQQQQQQQQQQQEEGVFTVVSLDESFFFYDSLVRRYVWIEENHRPVVKVTGSHKHSCIFGAVSMEGKKQQLFRHYEIFNGDTYLSFLKKIPAKFPKCYLFMDKASPHYKSKKVRKYFEENKDILIPAYLPTASPPEFMVMEEIWNISKLDLLVLKYYSSFADLKNKISIYFRTKRFNLNMRNYCYEKFDNIC
ncbi:MAG: transposase [Candidatus Nitrosocosmicus sp.]